MSKKVRQVYQRKDLYFRGWTDTLIEKLLPKELPTGGWYIQTVEVTEEEQFRIKKDNKINTKNSKKIEKKVKNILQAISNGNPAENYPLARELKRHFIINVGETNTGKTYTALQELKKVSDGIYLSPLRLLAMEVQDSLLEDGCLCSMSTGEEENIIPFSTVMSSTVEKLDISHKYDLGVIDECQMIEDSSRGGAWTRAILGLRAEKIYLCMSEDALDICIKLIEMCNDTYEIHRCTRTVPLTMMKYDISIEDLQKGDALILFSRREVLEYALTLENLGIRASVIYGALPYEARKHQVDLYKTGKTDIVVSTDAIGMGLNLPIKRIIFASETKFDGKENRKLFSQEVKQIAGRAGRRGIYEEGFVSVFSEGNAKLSTIKTRLQEEPHNIDKAILPFPEECINEKLNLSEIMNLWRKIEYPTLFITENLEEEIKKVKYLEKNYPDYSKNEMLMLSKVIFDDGNEDLFETYCQYIEYYDKSEEIPWPERVNSDNLKKLELNYKELQLYYSFHKTMGLTIDMNQLQEEKAIVVRKINKALAKEKKIAKPKTCRYCGNKLPPFFKFNICEDCYHGRNRYSQYWDDEYDPIVF